MGLGPGSLVQIPIRVKTLYFATLSMVRVSDVKQRRLYLEYAGASRKSPNDAMSLRLSRPISAPLLTGHLRGTCKHQSGYERR